ncbi:MAG: hypothetical protein FWH29_02010 [Methanobrevibacter sp.]|nr:hypothetical protein [Methanobrevibacter sp.]
MVDDNYLTYLAPDYRCITANNIANINNEIFNSSLSQMFEDRKLNKVTYLFEKKYGNKSVEYVTMIANNGQIVLNNFTSNLSNTVYLPKNIENLGKTNGLMTIIHNHTNKVPLPSHRDVYKSMTLKVKNIVATTEGKYNGLLINNNRFKIENNDLLKNEAIKLQNKFQSIEKNMKNNFIKSKS